MLKGLTQSRNTREEKMKGHEKIFEEIIDDNFPNMEKEIVNQVKSKRHKEFHSG